MRRSSVRSRRRAPVASRLHHARAGRDLTGWMLSQTGVGDCEFGSGIAGGSGKRSVKPCPSGEWFNSTPTHQRVICCSPRGGPRARNDRRACAREPAGGPPGPLERPKAVELRGRRPSAPRAWVTPYECDGASQPSLDGGRAGRNEGRRRDCFCRLKSHCAGAGALSSPHARLAVCSGSSMAEQSVDNRSTRGSIPPRSTSLGQMQSRVCAAAF
jgi:hypothetical protein